MSKDSKPAFERTETMGGTTTLATPHKAPPTPDTMGSKLWLAFLIVGVWITFTMFGWAQESLTRNEWKSEAHPEGEKFTYTSFLVLLQSVGNSFVAAAVMLLTRSVGPGLSGGTSTKNWLIVSVSYLGAHKFGLMSLKYIIFPLQVLVKSCKAVPVMFGEAIFDSKVKLTPDKIASVLLLIAGVVVFNMGEKAKKPKKGGKEGFEMDNDTMYGLGLVLLALICDGIYGPYQNKIKNEVNDTYKDSSDFKGWKLTPYHLMWNMNLWQGIVSLGFCIVGNELQDVAAFVSRHPLIVVDLLKFASCMAAGNLFIYRLQAEYGALTVTKTTTVRKLISILFSVWWFGHQLQPIQWLGAGLVFVSEPLAKMLAKEKVKAH